MNPLLQELPQSLRPAPYLERVHPQTLHPDNGKLVVDLISDKATIELTS